MTSDVKSVRPLCSSDSPDWCTPPEILDIVRGFAPIRFDPFSNPGSLVQAAESVGLPQDSLVLQWPLDGLIWCNPPYGRALARCAATINEQARRGAEIMTLVPARTDTQWWHALSPDLWCAWRGRITFLELESSWRARISKEGTSHKTVEPRRRVGPLLVANESAPFPAALCYHGWRPLAFARHFANCGPIYAATGDEAPVAKRGRPPAHRPPLAAVMTCIDSGMSIRATAALFGVPKNRIEGVRKAAIIRTGSVSRSSPPAGMPPP